MRNLAAVFIGALALMLLSAGGAAAQRVTPLTGAEQFPLQFPCTIGCYTTTNDIKNFVGGGGGGTPANPTATAGPNAVNGSATTYMRSDAAPAVQKGSNSQFGIVQCDNSTTSCAFGVIAVIGGGGGGTPANPTATGGPNAVNGSATTFMRSDAAPAIQLGTNVIPGLAQGDNVTISLVAGIAQLIGLNGLVSISANCGNTTGGGGVAIGTVRGILKEARAITVYPDTMLASDCGLIDVYRSGSNVVVSMPTAGSTGFEQNYGLTLCNAAAGVVTLTPLTGTIGGLSSYSLTAGTESARNCIGVYSGTFSGAAGAFVANDYGVLSH